MSKIPQQLQIHYEQLQIHRKLGQVRNFDREIITDAGQITNFQCLIGSLMLSFAGAVW